MVVINQNSDNIIVSANFLIAMGVCHDINKCELDLVSYTNLALLNFSQIHHNAL